MAQIIPFPLTPRTPRPIFSDWLTAQVGGHWCVVKVRRRTWRGIDMGDRVQLLAREYADYRRQYEEAYGAVA